MNELTEAERTALKKFKENVKDIVDTLEDYYDVHDANLVRWLRARDLDIKKAEEMFRKSMKWREEHEADDLQNRSFTAELSEKVPFMITGHDKKDALIVLVPLSRVTVHVNELFAAGREKEVFMHLLQLMEYGTKYMKHYSTPQKILTQFTIVYDFENVSFTNVFSKHFIRYSLESLRAYEANYPERLASAYVVNAPKIFELFWNMLKPILSTHTMSKVYIFGKNTEKWRKALTTSANYRELTSYFGGSNSTHPWFEPKHAQYTEWPPRAGAFTEEEFSTEVIPAGKKFLKAFDLQPKDRISWNFKTEGFDIGFEFLKGEERVFDYARADAHICVQDGLVDIEEASTYTLVFDNSYSKYRAKTLHYAIRVEQIPS